MVIEDSGGECVVPPSTFAGGALGSGVGAVVGFLIAGPVGAAILGGAGASVCGIIGMLMEAGEDGGGT